MVYYFDVKLVHAFIFIIPCVLVSLFKIWTKLVAKSQAEIISRKLNEELVKLVWIMFEPRKVTMGNKIYKVGVNARSGDIS